jgi:hypothetical protein
MDADGDFVVLWHSDGQDGNLWGVYAQRYDAYGQPEGSEFRGQEKVSGTFPKPDSADRPSLGIARSRGKPALANCWHEAEGGHLQVGPDVIL